MLHAQDPLAAGQQGGELVPGGGPIPRVPGPGGKAVAGGQGVRVLRSVGVILRASVDDHLEQVPGRRIATAVAEVIRDPEHAAAGQVEDGLGVRQQRRARRPAPWQFLVGRDRGLDQGGGSLPPLPSQLGWHLVGGDGLDQPVHRHHPVSRRADQRIPAHRRDRVPGRQRVLQQRGQHRRHLSAEPLAKLRAGLQQQPQRDRLGRAERQQPQQPGRARPGLRQIVKRQPPGGGHRLGVLDRLATAQHVQAPPPE